MCSVYVGIKEGRGAETPVPLATPIARRYMSNSTSPSFVVTAPPVPVGVFMLGIHDDSMSPLKPGQYAAFERVRSAEQIKFGEPMYVRKIDGTALFRKLVGAASGAYIFRSTNPHDSHDEIVPHNEVEFVARYLGGVNKAKWR